MDIKTLFAELVSNKIGHSIGADHIHTDEKGWDYYIPSKKLQKNHPVILRHYRGPLFVVLPFADWKALEQDAMDVKAYIDNSVWSFGYFWGGGSLLGGVHWQPLENGKTGINDTQKISRYLTILKCRTHEYSSGYMPTNEYCSKCSVNHCPFSAYAPKSEGASWDNEVIEQDDRILFYTAVKERIQNEFGFKATSCMSHQRGDVICLYASYKADTVEVYLPEDLLIDMLYNPGKHDITRTANSLTFEAGIECHYDGDTYISSKQVAVPAGAGKEFFYDYWKSSPRFNYWWFREESNEVADAN